MKLSDSETQVREMFDPVASGYDHPQVQEHDFGLPLPNAEAWWEIVYNAGYRGMLERLGDEQRPSFKAKHLSEVRELITTKGHTRLNVQVLVAQVKK